MKKLWVDSLGTMRRILPLVLSSGLVLAGGLALPSANASDCTKTSVGFTPLNDLGSGTYQGFSGGLYPNGANVRPSAHESAGLTMTRALQPLNSNGQPDSQNGKIVLISVGMSNTTQEFTTFQPIANQDPDKNPRLSLVDGAQGGWSADRVVSNGSQFWATIDQRLAAAGLTPAQVQIAWLKEADASPTLSFPNDATQLQGELKTIVQTIKQRYPNTKLVYLSSRIYAGYASTNLNPEPYAYQSGFAVKWLIQDQINGSAELNYDSSKGTVKAPWLSWGPYLWADGLKPRSDGLIWDCLDFVTDGTHPSTSGRNKVAQMLLQFLRSDTTTIPWFMKSATAALFRVELSGYVFSDGAFYGSNFYSGTGADLAERIDLSERVEPGDVIEIDPYHAGHYRKAHTAYSPLITGVISIAPGFLVGDRREKIGQAKLALVGRVPVKAVTENGPIHLGDLLTSASRPGYAMRCSHIRLCEEAILGKALEALESGSGTLLMLVMSH